MRLTTLHLLAFGPFTNRVLDFWSGAHRLVVYGANETGKSSALRFGIPVQSKDNFLHAYFDLKLGGELVDAQGNAYSLLRRKGRGATLLNTLFTSDHEHADDTPASAATEVLLTGGLTLNAYDTMFSLDHQGLRAGGEALLKEKAISARRYSRPAQACAAFRQLSKRLRIVPENFLCLAPEEKRPH
jgi:DNA repair protein SbcC/Rad50